MYTKKKIEKKVPMGLNKSFFKLLIDSEIGYKFG